MVLPAFAQGVAELLDQVPGLGTVLEAISLGPSKADGSVEVLSQAFEVHNNVAQVLIVVQPLLEDPSGTLVEFTFTPTLATEPKLFYRQPGTWGVGDRWEEKRLPRHFWAERARRGGPGLLAPRNVCASLRNTRATLHFLQRVQRRGILLCEKFCV